MHHQCDPSVGGEAGAPLFVVDIAGSRLAQPMVRRAVRQAIDRAVAAAREANGRIPRPRILLHGDGNGLTRGQDVEVLSTLDYALPHVGSADEPWVNATSNELLYGRGAQFFPVVDGVSLADLCRLEVQDYYLDYAHLAGALCRVLAEKATSSCTIYSIDPERAESLRASIAHLVGRVDVWSPPFITGLRQIGRTLRQQISRSRRDDVHASRTRAIRDFPNVGALRAPVLFVSEAAPMAQMFAVVERHLEKAHDLRSLRLQLAGSRSTIMIENEDATVVATLGHPSALPSGRQGRLGAQWRETARASRSVVIEKPYGGAPGVALLRGPVRHLLEHLYWERFDRLIEHLEFAHLFVETVRPDVLVVGNDRWWVGQAFVRAAQLRGIPTLLIQDGLACDKATWSWISADRVAAFSPLLEEVLVSHGVARDRITITGQPRYDSLCAKRQIRDPVSIRAARASVGASPTAACVLLATQPHQDAERVAVAVEALLTLNGVQLLLRPHPSEPAGKYGGCLTAHGDRVLLARGTSIDALLDAADVVVTEYSTVALEGAMLSIPVIIASFLGDRSDPRLFDGLSVVARSPEELRLSARAFLPAGGGVGQQTVDARRLRALVGPMDGRSGARVAGMIQSLRARSVRASVPSARERQIDMSEIPVSAES